jgi:hypothetical protein
MEKESPDATEDTLLRALERRYVRYAACSLGQMELRNPLDCRVDRSHHTATGSTIESSKRRRAIHLALPGFLPMKSTATTAAIRIEEKSFELGPTVMRLEAA